MASDQLKTVRELVISEINGVDGDDGDRDECG